MAVQAVQQPLPVQPEPAGGPAAVALPGGGLVRCRAGEQQRPVLPRDVGDRDVGDGAPGQPAAGVAVEGDGVGPGEVREGLAVRGDGEDAAVGRPAAHAGVGAAPVGEPGGRAALHGGHVDLRVQAAPVRVRDVPAVRREAGVPDLRAVDREAPGAAGFVQAGHPQVVLGHEAQPVAAEVREAQIAGRGLVLVAHPPMLFRGGEPGNRRRQATTGAGHRAGSRRRAGGPGHRGGPPGRGGRVTQHTYETVSFR